MLNSLKNWLIIIYSKYVLYVLVRLSIMKLYGLFHCFQAQCVPSATSTEFSATSQHG